MAVVSISELKSHLSEHLRRAEAGEVIEVCDRARPIARVVPMAEDSSAIEVVPAERSFSAVRTVRLPPVRLKLSSLEALRQERGSR